jgi:glycosyltransferase involved in cell wall biosynthesis
MRIFTALTYYRPHYSGLTIYAERVARALVHRGHQVTVLTSRYDRSLLSSEQRDDVEVVRSSVWLRISKGVIMPGMLWQAWRLGRQADVFLLHMPQLDAAPIAWMGKLLRKPVVLVYQCDLILPKGLVHRLANTASNLASLCAGAAATAIVHITQDYANSSPFLQRFSQKVRTIMPPIEMEPVDSETLSAFLAKYQIQPDEEVIGMVARLATEKGVEYLVQALPYVLAKHPKARVLFVGPYQNIVGEEVYAAKINSLIKTLGDHWSFLGVLTPLEFSAFFKCCTVTVLPSINSTESFGLVQLESMLCGTPVIASDRPGMRVPVKETGMGLIFPAGDSHALAQALIQVLDHPDAYQGHPQQMLERSTPQAVAQAYEILFEQLISGDSQ